MAKGLRLSFLGQRLDPKEMSLLASCRGYNTYPNYNGWGPESSRNYLAFSSGESYEICMGLVLRGLMCYDCGKNYVFFHTTNLGRRVLELFRRHHKHPRLNLLESHRRNK